MLKDSVLIDNYGIENLNTVADSFVKKRYKKYSIISKWPNLKLLLKDVESLDKSVNLLKKLTIEQFSSKCIKIYEAKIKIHLLTQKNKEVFKSPYSFDKKFVIKNNNIDYIISKLKINEGAPSDAIQDFFFYFRENNDYMMRLIECADTNNYDTLIPFLCHFFYENFYIENNEQEELLYIIYLLLEKEIDALYTPSVSTFLESSFLSKFLAEIGNRYEIKHYIDIILNNLIRNIEERNTDFFCLDINNFNRNKNKNNNNNISNDIYMIYSTYNNIGNTYKNDEDIIRSSDAHKLKRSNNFFNLDENNETKKISIKELKLNLFVNIDLQYIREKVENETNENMKHFYIRLLKKIIGSKNPNLFNSNAYYEKINLKKKINMNSMTELKKGFDFVTKFIDELLKNLENMSIVPYPLKVICKLIFILLQKKFKRISIIQRNLLVCKFLFDKLILPVLENPDINNTEKSMIISFNTRKNLSNIYRVLKNLIRGELFDNGQYIHMTIFNNFIINNFLRVNKIIEKIIHVKIPEKLMKLSEQFYLNETISLDDLKRSEEEIKYDYFLENPNDFMYHKSICFTIKELTLFYDIVNKNKEKFIEKGKSFHNIFDKLSAFIPLIKSNDYEYYVIISNNYYGEIKDLLFHENIKIAFGKKANSEQKLKNIKYCITKLISNLDIFPNWETVTETLDTIGTFKLIDHYLASVFKQVNYFKFGNVPLSWYSSYIIKNINNIDYRFIKNDYLLLYENIENEIVNQIKKLRKLNNFLTINMTTKFFVINKKKKKFSEGLEDIKDTELNIKTMHFIESAKINVCFTNIFEVIKINKTLNFPIEQSELLTPFKFIISKTDNCIHQEKTDKKIYIKLKPILIKNKTHCYNINDFAERLSNFYLLICEDIVGLPQLLSTKKKGKKNSLGEIVNKKTFVKEILEKYMSYVSEKVDFYKIFEIPKFNDIKNNNIINDINDENIEKKLNKQKKINEENKSKLLDIIRNYILRKLCIKIYQNESNRQDEDFNRQCKSLSWLTHSNLDIPNEVFNNLLFSKSIYHIQKMDLLRTPNGMLKEFSLAVQLINSMFIFMLNQRQAEAGDLLPLIIYAIITARPKRIIFNIKFINFFMNKNLLLGNIGYNLIQAESSIHFIKTINGKYLKMDDQEFKEKCRKCYDKEKNRKIEDDNIV